MPPSSIEAAFRVSMLGGKKEIAAMLASLRDDSHEAKVCLAGIAMRDGNPAEAIRILRRLLTRVPWRDKGIVADSLATFLSGRKELAEAEQLLDSHEPSTPVETALLSANRAVVYAIQGNSKASEQAALFAYDTVQTLDDEFLHIVVLFRLGRAANYRGENAIAMDLALRSAQLASAAGYTRFAGIAYSTAYDAASLPAEFDLKCLYAAKMMEYGRRSDDMPTILYGLVCQMTLAAEAGEEDALRALIREYQGYCLPRQNSEDHLATFATALPFAWRGDFAAFEDAVAHFPEHPNFKVAIADRLSLLSLCAYVRGDIAKARSLSRQVLHQTGTAYYSPAHDRTRRIARIIAAFVCVRIGDVHRGERVLASKDLAGSPEVTIIDPHKVPKAWMGFSKLLRAAELHSTRQHKTLTPSQTALVRRFAEGMSIPEIARETGRSQATLRAQAQQINKRLGVKGRARAVARARELRIV
jgi:DNA-binding CsgD family transcriptional regulator